MRGVMAVLAILGATSGWPGLFRSHCTEHAAVGGTMAMHGHSMDPAPNAPVAPSSGVQSSHADCTHCPPSDCATTAPCANPGGLGLPTRLADWSITNTLAYGGAHGPASIHSAVLTGLTPPPQRIL